MYKPLFYVKSLSLHCLSFPSSLAAAVDEPNPVNGVLAAVAADLSSQDVWFRLGTFAADLSAAEPEQTDSPSSLLSASCAECDWRDEVRINETTDIVIDDQSLYVVSISDYGPRKVVPLPGCNITSATHDNDQQSIIVLCGHAPSKTSLKLFHYNYSSGVLTKGMMSTPNNELLRRGTLVQIPSAESGTLTTYAVFPLQEEPYILMAYNVKTGFSLTIEVLPEDCLAVQQISVVKRESHDFFLLHCSSIEGSNKIDLLVFADLAEGNFDVYYDLQSSGISYDPYTAIVRSTLSSKYCVIALRDSPRILVLDLISAIFETRPLTNIAGDAILVDDSYAVYAGASDLYWFSPFLLFSKEGEYHLPKLVHGSANTCFPPLCPRFQMISGKNMYVVSTTLHSDTYSVLVHHHEGDNMEVDGSVVISIAPSWYLPFIDSIVDEPMDPTATYMQNPTDPSLSPSPSITGPEESTRTSVMMLVIIATFIVVVTIFLLVVVVLVVVNRKGLLAVLKRVKYPVQESSFPVQVVQGKESALFHPRYIPRCPTESLPSLDHV